LPAVVRILGEAAADDVIEIAGSERFDGRYRSRIFFENGGSDAELAFAREGALAREHFV
jgi:hypothetical protein